MKILIFIPHMGLGGVERSFINLSKELSSRGHVVKFISLKNTETTYSEDIKHINLDSNRTLFSINKLSKIFKKESPNLIISAQYYANIIAIVSNKISQCKAKIIISERNHLSSELKKYNFLKRSIIVALIKIFYKEANLIYGNSNQVCDDLNKNFTSSTKAKKILNASFPKNINELAKEKITDDWITKCNVPLLIYIGRLEPQKDIGTLLKAFEIFNSNNNSKLLIIGNGSDSYKLLSCPPDVKSKIKHIDFDENPYKYLKYSDILLLTSVYEGMPNILIEAQVLEIPIVATNCPGGTSEVLMDGKTGLLSKTGDPEDIANKIFQLMKNKKITDEFKLNYKKSIERFNPENVANQLLNEVNKI